MSEIFTRFRKLSVKEEENAETEKESFSIKLILLLTYPQYGYTERRQYIFERDELLLEDHSSPPKQDMSSYLAEHEFDSDAITDMFDKLVRFSRNSTMYIDDGFKGTVTLMMVVKIVHTDPESLTEESPYEIRFKPASKSAIKGLKTTKFKKQGGVKRSSCRICLEDEFLEGVDVAEMSCGHEFHTECMVEWLGTSHMCPLCRFALPCVENSQ